MNFWAYVMTSRDTMVSNHFFSYFTINHATPVAIMALFSVIILTIQMIFAPNLQKWGFTMSPKDIMVDEDLPNFFKSVRLAQADEVV